MGVEKYLVLNKFILDRFGFEDQRPFYEYMKKVKEPNIADDEPSSFIEAIKQLSGLKIDREKLEIYDSNIRSHLRKINRHRDFQPKYFQYLALLITEYHLDRLKNEKESFREDLNNFIREYETKNRLTLDFRFTDEDLNKLAYWMATGSGKTLIMHVNYYQFLHYDLFSPDSILLITPNETLSKQHLREFQKSGIPAEIYRGTLDSNLFKNRILIIEITKIAEEARGGGITLPAEAFEGRNLLFVDEGHKGKKSEEQKWAKIRNKLAERGFVFEYSATFGQILEAPKKTKKDLDSNLKEYAKSIIFDYSYKYFYLDGYGKDFFVFNIRKADYGEEEYRKLSLSAALLYFYQQLLHFEENKEIARKYNFEKPLWMLIGTTVTGNVNSDILNVVKFIDFVLSDKESFTHYANVLLSENAGLVTEDGKNFIREKLEYLVKRKPNPNDVYKKVFGGLGNLEIYEIKNAEGEFGLKTAEGNYFGVVNIGNVSEFKKMLERNGFTVFEDKISGSLFDGVTSSESDINMVIGSKKFIEGWDTWRVSTIGLLNIGKGAGPQIIQLFGRGVRIKGENYSLKRTGQEEFKSLETVGIFGIRANYLESFLTAIRKEEVEYEEIKIPVTLFNLHYLEKLKTPYIDRSKKFTKDCICMLTKNENIQVELDIRPKFTAIENQERKDEGIVPKAQSEDTGTYLNLSKYIKLINWEKVLLELFKFKKQKLMWNLIITGKVLREILSDSCCSIRLTKFQEQKIIGSKEELTELAIRLLKKYVEKYYRREFAKYEKQYIKPGPALKTTDKLLDAFVKEETEEKKYYYVVKVNKQAKSVINKLKKLSNDINELLRNNPDDNDLPRIVIDESIFVPLLIKKTHSDFGTITPDALEKSEEDFVINLKKYIDTHKYLSNKYQIFLLRNLPFKGVGFQLESCGFYPDFILWLLDKDTAKQIIVFVEPHGLYYEKELLRSEKISFISGDSSGNFVTLKQIEKELGDKNIQLEGFIISPTSYKGLKPILIDRGEKDVPKKELLNETMHILFAEDDYIEQMFKLIGINDD